MRPTEIIFNAYEVINRWPLSIVQYFHSKAFSCEVDKTTAFYFY